MDANLDLFVDFNGAEAAVCAPPIPKNGANRCLCGCYNCCVDGCADIYIHDVTLEKVQNSQRS